MKLFNIFRRKKYSIIIIKSEFGMVKEYENLFLYTFRGAQIKMKRELKKFISHGGNTYFKEKVEESNWSFAQTYGGTIDIGITKIN